LSYTRKSVTEDGWWAGNVKRGLWAWQGDKKISLPAWVGH